MIRVGDIVKFKRIQKINLSDLIAKRKYSKYMLVVEVFKNLRPGPACKVLCANGEISWVSLERIQHA